MRYLFFLLIFNSFISNAQVIKIHDILKERSNDSTLNLQYFKNIDSVLINKLDSFDLYLSKKMYELDSNYFFTIDLGVLRKASFRKEIIIKYGSQYNDYISVSNLVNNKSPFGNRTVFAFSFYKNKLVLFTILKKNLSLTNDASKLLTNLVYEHVNTLEKKLILGFPQYSSVIKVKPIKSYFLD
jgi:hypothetical protein